MTVDRQHPPEAGNDAPTSRSRRWIVLIGAGGAAGLLAGGVLFAAQMRDSHQERPPEVVVAAPLDTTTAPGPEPASDAGDPTAAETVAPETTAPEPAETDDREAEPPQPRTTERVRDEIEQARARAAEEGVTLQRPLKAQGAQVEHHTEKTKNGTIRVTTAREDLTGKAPLTVAAGEGTKVGSAQCTDRVRFSEGAPAVKRPNLLLCWRTSSDRSVVTMAVTPKGKPKAETSVKIIDREWAKLG